MFQKRDADTIDRLKNLTYIFIYNKDFQKSDVDKIYIVPKT